MLVPLTESTKKNDLNVSKNSDHKDILKHYFDQFESLIKEFSTKTPESEWDLRKSDVTKRRTDIYIGSKTVETQSHGMPLHSKEKKAMFLKKTINNTKSKPVQCDLSLREERNVAIGH